MATVAQLHGTLQFLLAFFNDLVTLTLLARIRNSRKMIKTR